MFTWPQTCSSGAEIQQASARQCQCFTAVSGHPLFALSAFTTTSDWMLPRLKLYTQSVISSFARASSRLRPPPSLSSLRPASSSRQNHAVPHTHVHSMATLTNGNAYGNFDLFHNTKLDFADITVSKWRSRVTGLSVIHLDYNGA